MNFLLVQLVSHSEYFVAISVVKSIIVDDDHTVENEVYCDAVIGPSEVI